MGYTVTTAFLKLEKANKRLQYVKNEYADAFILCLERDYFKKGMAYNKHNKMSLLSKTQLGACMNRLIKAYSEYKIAKACYEHCKAEAEKVSK